jgi:anti-sigma B factor antagonist
MPEQSQRSRAAFAVSHRHLDARTSVLCVEGDCDLASAPTLKWAMVDLLAEGRSRLIVDLSRVTFMDSTALGALVGIQMNMKAGELLLLAAAPPGVVSLFELTGLDRRLSLFPTPEAAITHVGAAIEGGAISSPRVEAQAVSTSVTDRTDLTRDAALALGIAATAVPFARSRQGQAERWLRALQRQGGAGIALTSLGVSDVPAPHVSDREAAGPESHMDTYRDAVAGVTDHARRLAARRGEGSPIRTTDLLEAVIAVYGADLDRVLVGYGTTGTAVTELLADREDDLPEP